MKGGMDAPSGGGMQGGNKQGGGMSSGGKRKINIYEYAWMP